MFLAWSSKIFKEGVRQESGRLGDLRKALYSDTWGEFRESIVAKT